MERPTPTPAGPAVPQLLTPKQAAQALAVSPSTLYGLTHAGKIPCIRLSRAVRYDVRDVEAWIGRQKVGVVAPEPSEPVKDGVGEAEPSQSPFERHWDFVIRLCGNTEPTILPPTTADVEARAAHLLSEFQIEMASFHRFIKQSDPDQLEPDGSVDRKRVFEGWCLQRIAALQCVVEHQSELLRAMNERMT